MTITRCRSRAGHREAHPAAGRTICDALMAAMPGELTFAINSKLLAKGVSVSDEEVGAAVAFAYRELKLVVEPGGAVGLAALARRPHRCAGARTSSSFSPAAMSTRSCSRNWWPELDSRRSRAEHSCSAPFSLA